MQHSSRKGKNLIISVQIRFNKNTQYGTLMECKLRYFPNDDSMNNLTTVMTRITTLITHLISLSLRGMYLMQCCTN